MKTATRSQFRHQGLGGGIRQDELPVDYGHRTRRCGAEGCRTWLCRYNGSNRCWIHGGWLALRTQ